jgi:hypothetical protein
MRNWSTDTKRLEQNKEDYEKWRLEQQLNYGLEDGEKLDRALVEKYLPVLNIDSDTRDFLNFVLYDEKPAHRSTTSVR